MKALPAFSLHMVTSRRRLAPDARTISQEIARLEHQIDEAIAAGVDVIQIRERDLEAGPLLALASRVVGRALSTATAILVNDRADVAWVAAADGVHLPSTGVTADRLRGLSDTWILGRSVHGDDAPTDAGACDYVLFGTVFPSESKGDPHVAAGVEAIGRAAARFAQPVVAIGGVTPERVMTCAAAGARGVAAIGAFLPPGQARDGRGARAAVEQFRAAMAGIRPVRS